MRFAVSRQPVREAFINWRKWTYQIRPQRCGSYVNKISLSPVRNGCFVRAIECRWSAITRRRLTMNKSISWSKNLHQQRIAVDRQRLNDFSSA